MSAMLRFRAFVVALVAICGGIAIWASCAVYDRSLLEPGDGGPDVAVKDGGGDGQGCVRATVPERPTADDPAVLDGGELTFTVQHLDLAPRDDAGTLHGYDLDRSCTCPDTPSCRSPKQQCDDDAGRDNVGGIQLDIFSKFADGFDPSAMNARLALGAYGLLIRVRNWNGAPNDTAVELAYYVSKGTAAIDDAGTRVVPKFDGTDEFSVAKASLLGGVAPPYIPQPDAVDTAAYVRDGVVVASLNNIRIELSTSNKGLNYLELNLTGAIISARITKVNGQYRLTQGTIAGRWLVRKLLNALAPLTDQVTGGSYLCGDSGTYQTIKDFICSNVDISGTIQNDNTSANCDAVSTGFGFSAVPVTFGPVVAGPTLAQPCGPSWNDDCPSQ